MNDQNEYEKRCKAIQLYNQGIRFSEIVRFVQRSKGWLAKWLNRFKENGIDGLKDRSRAPKQIWRKTPDRMVKKILSTRE